MVGMLGASIGHSRSLIQPRSGPFDCKTDSSGAIGRMPLSNIDDDDCDVANPLEKVAEAGLLGIKMFSARKKRRNSRRRYSAHEVSAKDSHFPYRGQNEDLAAQSCWLAVCEGLPVGTRRLSSSKK